MIDDRVTNRHVLSRLASQADEDAVVHTFADPRDAIAWSTENTPDLVVTDFKMPGMDAAEFTRQFRAQPLCYDVPVIVVTIYEDRSYRYRALEAGATDFLISPVNHQEFKARVRNFLRMRNQQKIIHRRTRSLERRLANDNMVHQEELRETRELLRQVIEAVLASICATDRDGKVLFANAMAAKRVGLTPEEAVGRRRGGGLESDDALVHVVLDGQFFKGFGFEPHLDRQKIGGNIRQSGLRRDDVFGMRTKIRNAGECVHDCLQASKALLTRGYPRIMKQPWPRSVSVTRRKPLT